MKKQLLAVFLALALCVGLMPGTAFAGSSFSDATDISFGVTYEGEIKSREDKKHYKFTLSSSGRITFTATFTGYYSSIDFDLYTMSGDEVTYMGAYYGDDGKTSNTFDLTGGEYCIVVSKARLTMWTDSISYSFKVEFSSANESFEETVGGTDNSMDTANEISLDESYRGSIAINDEKDFYQFTVPSSGKINFTATSKIASVYYYIYSASGTRLWIENPTWDRITGRSVINRTIDLPPGVCYLAVVRENYGTRTGNYEFRISDAVVRAEGVTVSKSSLKLTEGDSDDLTATVSPRDATNQTVSWSSSDDSVATVDVNGRVSAVSPGTATITVTTEDGGYTDRCRVTVEERIQNVRWVSLSESYLELTEGDSAALTATVSPDNATNQTVSWSSSDRSVARVDDNGRVSAVSPGTATITVTTEDGGYAAQCWVKVEERVQNVTGVSLSQSSLTLTEGDSADLTAEVSPRDATNQRVSWFSDDRSIARVDDNGRVTAVSSGRTIIAVTTEDGGHTANCYVTVEKKTQKVTGVALSYSFLKLTEGDSAVLTATVFPQDAANQTVGWSSSDSSVARVDASGQVRAISPGTATVTVTTEDGGYTAKCHVTVEKKTQKVTGVSLSRSTLTLTEGDSAALAAAVSPHNATNQTVSWSSSDSSVARVDDNGRVTAISPGTATVTVTTEDGGYTDRCHVTVEAKAVAPDPSPTPGATSAEVHFSRANVYHQDQFTDVPANQWFTSSVAEAFELGLMKGNSDTTFNPDGDVTVAEAVIMACRIHAIYTTGSASAIVPQSGSPWYQPYLDYAFQNGIITSAYYNSDVTQKATRAQFAEIFANSLPEEALPAINTIGDNKIPDVPMSAYYAGSVYKLYRAGILAGGDVLGTFSPASYITRKEAAAIVSRMAESNNRKSFTL